MGNIHIFCRISFGFATLFAILSAVLIIAILVYLGQNSTGHTSVQPYLGLGIFIPALLFGAISARLNRGSPGKYNVSLVAFALGGLGALFLVYLDFSNTLLYYEEWLKRGLL